MKCAFTVHRFWVSILSTFALFSFYSHCPILIKFNSSTGTFPKVFGKVVLIMLIKQLLLQPCLKAYIKFHC
jgi:hypothetical protein